MSDQEGGLGGRKTPVSLILFPKQTHCFVLFWPKYRFCSSFLVFVSTFMVLGDYGIGIFREEV